MTGFARELAGYRLTLLEITYYMPDHRSLLQTFGWQLFDLAPEFPEVKKFLNFWERDLAEAPIHSVRYCSSSIIGRREFRMANTILTLKDGRPVLH